MTKKKAPFNRQRFEAMFPEGTPEMTAEDAYRHQVASWNRAIFEANRLSGSLRRLGHETAAFFVEKAWRLLRESPPTPPKPAKVERRGKSPVKQLMRAQPSQAQVRKAAARLKGAPRP
ncbi:hypothetical protein [Rhizobium hidalgonense]|uniref:hypothetical protein n=1 Tax=Rhizobium hidalgonense TaxID=1538159 RepID=UPI0011057BA7|nr:hypothetical protein [Rhizobium hidalgonense]QKK26957.1 hypothetical protein FFM81_027200 [Rhizobium hidalgonense]